MGRHDQAATPVAERSLRSRWAVLAGPDAVAAGERLMAAWRGPERHYHSLAHLGAVLDRIDELDPTGAEAPALEPAGRDEPGLGGLTASGAARMAAWYHDAVYRPGQPGNEAASAVMAEEELGALGWDPGARAEVARLVLVTVEHRCRPADGAAALLCDADLAVLGSSDTEYARYVAAVRAEHADVSAAGWRRGRSAVLASLLERDRLFATPSSLARWEDQARRNLAAELADLAPGHPGR